jgi:hypothetical protein
MYLHADDRLEGTLFEAILFEITINSRVALTHIVSSSTQAHCAHFWTSCIREVVQHTPRSSTPFKNTNLTSI